MQKGTLFFLFLCIVLLFWLYFRLLCVWELPTNTLSGPSQVQKWARPVNKYVFLSFAKIFVMVNSFINSCNSVFTFCSAAGWEPQLGLYQFIFNGLKQNTPAIGEWGFPLLLRLSKVLKSNGPDIWFNPLQVFRWWWCASALTLTQATSTCALRVRSVSLSPDSENTSALESISSTPWWALSDSSRNLVCLCV